MELLNANSKLINYHILKKNTAAGAKQSDSSNKSMDFSLSFRSDFNINNKFNKARRGTKKEMDDMKPNKLLLNKKSFSNILDMNPATLIKQ
jgi:hypothetical protein